MADGLEILTSAQMVQADQLAIAGGGSGLALMEAAGRAVAEVARKLVKPSAPIVVLCGPGNNGGDGFVAARRLSIMGFRVEVFLVCDPASLRGDAAAMANDWAKRGAIHPLSKAASAVETCDLIIDAVFGTGLKRPLAGELAAIVDRIQDIGCRVLAVDVPSGLDADLGTASAVVIAATQTVTFFRRKPGHLLYPGRALCGRVIVVDIGIPPSILDAIDCRTFVNTPTLWRRELPAPAAGGHKYDRGHAVIVSGPATRTGAARLAARGALRVGAGLVTILAPTDALTEIAGQITAVMLEERQGPTPIGTALSDERRNAVLIGPATGVGEATRQGVLEALASAAGVVLDADALTSFAHTPAALFAAVRARAAPTIMTPHGGEFARLFGQPKLEHSKLDTTRCAATRSGSVVVYKGADTVIAAPDGRAAINENAPASLATAGAGDVLAGLATGLLAQGMPAFEAACAAVWMHGASAHGFGPGLIADDLPDLVPRVLGALLAEASE